jgi:hypothetical protein
MTSSSTPTSGTSASSATTVDVAADDLSIVVRGAFDDSSDPTERPTLTGTQRAALTDLAMAVLRVRVVGAMVRAHDRNCPTCRLYPIREDAIPSGFLG